MVPIMTSSDYFKYLCEKSRNPKALETIPEQKKNNIKGDLILNLIK